MSPASFDAFSDTPLIQLLPERATGHSLKWARYPNQDIVPMWVADMDFASPKPVIDALRALTLKGDFGYAHEPLALREVIAAYLDSHFGLTIEPEWIVHLPGLVVGLNVVCRLLNHGEGVMTHTPVYPPFLSAPKNQHCPLISVEMQCINHVWQLDMDAFEKAITPSTRLLLLCNPHNPTGRVFTRSELDAVAHLANRHDLLVCSDEIHCDLILEPSARHIPFASLNDEARQRTITLMAPSKTFNQPGLGYSYALIANPTLRRRFVQAMSGIVPHSGLLGMIAAEAAYREGWPWLAELRRYLKANRDIAFARLLALPKLRVTCPEGTYLMWIKAHDLGTKRPSEWFEAAGVGLSDGAPFGDPQAVRLNFACSHAVLEKALARIEAHYWAHQ